MNTRKTYLLFGLLVGLASPLQAVVFIEDFSDPLGNWTNGWLYLNTNIESYYVASGNHCDPNYRGTNPNGIWIGDRRGCGAGFAYPNADIDILNGFGDAATRFAVDICAQYLPLTLNIFDKDGVLDQSANVTAIQCEDTPHPTYDFVLSNGISKFQIAGTNVFGSTGVDNVTIDTTPQGGTVSRASFHVTKDFSDDNPMPVEVSISCNDGLPLKQSAMISDPDAGEILHESLIDAGAAANSGQAATAFYSVTFLVTNFTEGLLDCTVTETPVPDNYTAQYDDGTPSSVNCSYDSVVSGAAFNCVITNTADPATFTVTKEWSIHNQVSDEVDEAATVTIFCSNEIDGGYEDLNYWRLRDTLYGDGASLTATVDTTTGSTTCWASERQVQSGVETQDNCGKRTIAAGGSSSCTITNTVFFEGIPTLSQYGLALMALLMLGLGMVGFRRFA